MRWFYTAIVWAAAIGVGVVGSKFYKQWISKDRTSLGAIVKKHEQAWDAALADPTGKVTPPNTNTLIQESPLGHQSVLSKKLAEVDKKKVPAYCEKQWQATLKAVGSTPRPDADPLVANVPAEFQGDLR